jgi:hypothetical protein
MFTAISIAFARIATKKGKQGNAVDVAHRRLC